MPKISVIVPVYNVEQYLDICMQSLLQQTLQDIEIILVDDESPDNCPQLCEEYAQVDGRVKVVHRKNGGLGFARNSGLEIATGEYVTFVDSDDFVDHDTYRYLLQQHGNINPDAIFYNFQKFKGEELPEVKKDLPYKVVEGKEALSELKLNIIAAESHCRQERIVKCSACTTIYRRDILEKYHIRFHSERELVSEDMVFNLDFLNVACKVCMDESCLYFYRYNPASLTHTIAIEKLNRFATFDRYLREHSKEWGLAAEAEERVSRLTISSFRAAIVQVLTSNEDNDYKREFFQESVENDSLRYALSTYPIRNYALYQRVFAIAMKCHTYPMAKLLSLAKKIR